MARGEAVCCGTNLLDIKFKKKSRKIILNPSWYSDFSLIVEPLLLVSLGLKGSRQSLERHLLSEVSFCVSQGDY